MYLALCGPNNVVNQYSNFSGRMYPLCSNVYVTPSLGHDTFCTTLGQAWTSIDLFCEGEELGCLWGFPKARYGCGVQHGLTAMIAFISLRWEAEPEPRSLGTTR